MIAAIPRPSRDRFLERYLLAQYPSGGVIVDLSSGNYFRVNATAAMVCAALLRSDAAEELVADALAVTAKEASHIISEVVAGLATPAFRSEPPGAYHFFPTEIGYVLRQADRRLLEIDQAGQVISLPGGLLPDQPALLEFYVRALAPKLLFQRHITVLHASSCLTEDERVVAFAGLSGAGKTTTARAFAEQSMTLMSEDLLVFAPMADQIRVLVDAERFVHQWATRVAAALVTSPAGVLVGDLSAVTERPTVRIERILFLDRLRRRGDHFTTRSLDKPDALVTFMTHNFLGGGDRAAWRRYFAIATDLVEKIQMEDASAPDGVDRLPAAVAAYISNRTS